MQRVIQGLTFGGGGLDRDEDLRRHPDALAALPARTLPLWRGKPLLAAGGDALETLDGHAFAEAGEAVFIGRMGDSALFARDVSILDVDGGEDEGLGAFLDPSAQTRADLPPGSAFAELRGVMTQLPAWDAEAAATARAMLEWHRLHGYCPNCGSATRPEKAGWVRRCGACGRQHFPRTDPVVIMLVTRGDRCLLGRSHGWPERFYSCLAGFVEPGETMEAAVRREVWEETGVRVGPVSYLASQPWAFPHSLMLGAWGHAETEEIAIDPEEIENALWIGRDDMLDVMAGRSDRIVPARVGAIAHSLIHAWLEGRVA